MDEQTTASVAEGSKQDREQGGGGITLSTRQLRAIGVTAAAALVVGILVWPGVTGHPGPALGADGTPAEHTITVGGAGLVSVKPDVADVVIGVAIDKPTAKEARDAAGNAMNAVIAAIRKDGVGTDDIATVNIALEPVYDYNQGNSTPRLVGQRFSNTVRVTVRNLDTLPAVVDDAVSAGATTVGGIAFRLDNPKPIQAQARQAAMDDARAKADAIARAAGVSIKAVASVSETSYTPTPYLTNDAKFQAAGAPSTPIQTGTTDVSIQVTVTYVIG